MTTRINRSDFLAMLESLTPGLAAREIIQQSTCFVFSDNRIYTFNDEVACSRETKLAFSGAVIAKPLLELLSKLKEDEIELSVESGEFIVKGKAKKSGIRMESDVILPVGEVEVADDESWTRLPDDFSEAVSIVHSCASTEESQFVLTCINLTPEYLEASDRYQIARYPIQLGLDESTLIRAASLKKVTALDVTHVALTPNWLHFRSETGLTFSCRRYVDTYPDLGKYLDLPNQTKFVLPGGISEIVSAAEIFSSNNTVGNLIGVDLQRDRIVLTGQGAFGWYKEGRKITFTGQPIQFLIAPKLLIEIDSKGNECYIGEGCLSIKGSKFAYMTSTQVDSKVE